jgi:hypothetical protein
MIYDTSEIKRNLRNYGAGCIPKFAVHKSELGNLQRELTQTDSHQNSGILKAVGLNYATPPSRNQSPVARS